MGERARARIAISGRVQGVGFRAVSAHKAKRLGLDGWVRNLPDGRVEALAEGERARVEEFVAWCRHGPRSAVVEEVRVEWLAPAGDLGPFDIRA
jgi:acylphosphatase